MVIFFFFNNYLTLHKLSEFNIICTSDTYIYIYRVRYFTATAAAAAADIYSRRSKRFCEIE